MIGEGEERRRLLLERIAADGCPPLEQVEVEGWRLRAAAGVTRRANSALPLSRALPVDAVVDFYRARGLPPRVQVSTQHVDRELERRGWERDAQVTVLRGPVPAGPSSAELSPEPDALWTDCWWAVDGRGGDAEREVALQMLHRIAAPAAYVRVVRGEHAVAVGRGVVQEGHLGVFAMAVLPSVRRQGLGREVLHALGSWGQGLGAHTAYLQVLDENAAATALYASAGFAPAHGYHYRTLP